MPSPDPAADTADSAGPLIVGVGIDVAEARRFQRLIERAGSRFWRRWYRPGEVERCSRDAEPGVAAATRFAVKEATYKAVAAHFVGPVPWRDIEVLGDEPMWGVRLHGEIGRRVAAAGVRAMHVSTCHEAGRSVAIVLAEGQQTVHDPAFSSAPRECGPTLATEPSRRGRNEASGP